MDEIRLLPLNKAGFDALKMALEDWDFNILLTDNMPDWGNLLELPVDAQPEPKDDKESE